MKFTFMSIDRENIHDLESDCEIWVLEVASFIQIEHEMHGRVKCSPWWHISCWVEVKTCSVGAGCLGQNKETLGILCK